MSNLSSKAKRSKLKAGMYWESVSKTVSLGYRKGARTAKWHGREYVGTRDGRSDGSPYRKKAIAKADDGPLQADGKDVLSHAQAIQAAMEWATNPGHRHVRGLTIGDVVDDYISHYEAKTGDSTKTNSEIAKAWIKDDIRSTRIADMTTRQLEQWRNNLVLKKDVSRARANRIWTVLRAALNYGYKTLDLPNADRWKRIEPYGRTNQPRAVYLAPNDAQKLIAAMPDDFRALALGALYTGGRYRELTLMQVRHVNHRAGYVEFVFTKSGNRREVPLSVEGIEHFRQLVRGRAPGDLVFLKADGSPWTKSNQHRRMRRACEAAKLKNPVSFHVLRHSYASILAQSGMPMRSIQHLLGHSDMRITVQHYAHLQPDHVAAQIKEHLPSFASLSPDAVH